MDKVLPWDFHFLKHLYQKKEGLRLLSQKPDEVLDKIGSVDLNPGRDGVFTHTYFQLNSGQFVRLGFYVEEMEEEIHLTLYVFNFLKQNGVITEEGKIPLLGKETTYKLDSRNILSSRFLQLERNEGEIKKKMIDKRECLYRLVEYTAVGYPLLNVPLSRQEKVQFRKEVQVDA